MKEYCIFEDGSPFSFCEDWQEVIRQMIDRARGGNGYVAELHNQFFGPFETPNDLCVWLAELNGHFDRAVVVHPVTFPPTFMITHLLEPRFREG